MTDIEAWMVENPDAEITRIIKRLEVLEDGCPEAQALIARFFEIISTIEGLPPITVIYRDVL